MKQAKPLLAGIAAQLLFGFTMFFIKRGMAAVQYDTIKYLAFRYMVGFLCMTLLIALGIFKVNFRGKTVKYALLCGLFNPVISQVLETTSTNYAPTAQIAMFASLGPIVVVILGVLLFHEKTTRAGVAFCALSVFGVFLTSIGPMEGSTTIGLVLIVLMLFAVAFGRIFLREARLSLTAFEAVYITTAMGAVAFTATTLIQHTVRGDLSTFFVGLGTADFIVPVLYMGICSCVIAFSLMAYSATCLPVEVYAALNTIYTVVSMMVGAFVLHEKLEVLDIVGTAVILCGVLGAAWSGKPKPKLES